MDTNPPTSASDACPRILLPGSECLYLRVYCSANNCDYLLRQAVQPFVDAHRGGEVFTHWFFIRYADPDWHLRLRFFGAPAELLNRVLPCFTSLGVAALQAKRLYKVELGTYSREIERYGGAKAMAAAEALFGIDSEAVLALLRLFDSTEHLQDRWRIAVAGVDRLLDDFGVDAAGKLKMMTRLSAGYEAEFRTGKAFKDTLSRRFRTERQGLTDLLAQTEGNNELLSRGLEILAQRSARNRSAVAAYKTAFDHDRYKLEDAIEALVHMHLNRLLRSAQRAQELVIYNFLQRLYRSLNARQSADGVAA